MEFKQFKKSFFLAINGVILGGLVGLVAWLFLTVVGAGIHFIWEFIPHHLNVDKRYYTVFTCVLGGVLVGVCQKYFGKYPHEMDEVMAEFKLTKRVEYKTLHKTAITAIIILIFGASLGPEAGLSGVVSGLCTWVGDKLWYEKEEKQIITESGISAIIGTIFVSPLFGLFSLNKDDKSRIEVSNMIKWGIYFVTIYSGIKIFTLLSDLSNRHPFIVKFPEATLDINEWVAVIPLILVGILFGLFYILSKKLLSKHILALNKYPIITAVIGGLALGIIGALLPLTMFSGEHQLRELLTEWHSIPIYILFLTGCCKLFVTQVCLQTGWRGGHIYPVIFSGACLGYSISAIFSLDPVTSVAIITSSLTCFILKKPIAVALFLIVFFPMDLWLVIILSVSLSALAYNVQQKFIKTKQETMTRSSQL